jgi:hypothetical protein
MCGRCAVRVRQLIQEACNVGFFYGAMLEDPGRLLEGSGKRMRHVKLHPGRVVNAAALSDLIHGAYVDIGVRLKSYAGACGR